MVLKSFCESINKIEHKDKKVSQKTDTVSDNKVLFQKRKEFDREIRKREKDLEKAEELIEKLESEIAKTDELLANPQGTEDPDLYNNYEANKTKLSEQMNKWEALHLEIEDLQEQRKEFEN